MAYVPLLTGYKLHTRLFYLEDATVFSKTLGEHIGHIGTVVTALREAGVSLMLRKCNGFTDRIRYLGHIIRPGTLEVEEAETVPSKGEDTRRHRGSCDPSLGCVMYVADSLRATPRSQPHFISYTRVTSQRSCLSSILLRKRHTGRS